MDEDVACTAGMPLTTGISKMRLGYGPMVPGTSCDHASSEETAHETMTPSHAVTGRDGGGRRLMLRKVQVAVACFGSPQTTAGGLCTTPCVAIARNVVEHCCLKFWVTRESEP